MLKKVCIIAMSMLSWPGLLQAALPVCPATPGSAQNPVKMIFPDGQMSNRLLPVFVANVYLQASENEVSLQMKDSFPGMSLGSNLDNLSFSPLLIDRNQSWTVNELVAGQLTPRVYRGTLLLFDVSAFQLPFFRPFAQVVPVLRWPENNDGHSCQQLLSSGQARVNIGNAVGVFFQTGLLLFCMFLLLFAIAAKRYGTWRRVIDLLCESNGKLSLSKVQMTIWTLAIVGIVAVYSQTKMALPDIPWTLLALMGSSYATRALARWNDKELPAMPDTNDAPTLPTEQRMKPSIAHLVCDHQGCLSLPRAQMLVWTVLTVSIFVTKSLLDGQMWDVPIELVALMGLSQVGYAVPGMRSHGEADVSGAVQK